MKTAIVLIIIGVLIFLNTLGSKPRINVRYQIVEYALDTHVNVETKVENMTKKVSHVKSTSIALSEIPDDQEWQIIDRFQYKTVIAQIYKGESNFGRHDVCRARGGFNGFGWKESVTQLQTNGPVCFDSFEVLVSEINEWIDIRLSEGFLLSEINCYYVKGIRASDCETSYKLN